jgi:hypothetical protein
MDAQLERQKELTRAVLGEIFVRNAAPVDAVFALATAMTYCIIEGAKSREAMRTLVRIITNAIQEALDEAQQAAPDEDHVKPRSTDLCP